MTTTLPVTVSDHAVARLIERWAPHLDPQAARAEIDGLLARGHLVRTYPDGDQLWRGPKPRSIRLVVAHRDGLPTVVTVLPPYGLDGEPPEQKPQGLLPLANWTDVPGEPGKRTRSACRICRQPVVPVSADQSTCGAADCRSEYNTQLRAWCRENDPTAWAARLASMREAGRRYLDKHKGERNARRRAPAAAPPPAASSPDPWAAPLPAGLPERLPGAWRELVFAPAPHTPIPPSHATALHGVVSTALGRPHDPQRADFALLQAPVPSGWGVYFCDADDARQMSVAPMPGLHLSGRRIGVSWGPGIVVPKMPAPAPGRHAVRLVTLSPVVIRSTGRGLTSVRAAPTAQSLRASLTGREFLRRLGLVGEGGELPAWVRDVCLVLRRQVTERADVEVGGHWHGGDPAAARPRGSAGHGRVVGWSGEVELEVSAAGLWLLRAAEWAGLGGRVAVGCGQVRVQVL